MYNTTYKKKWFMKCVNDCIPYFKFNYKMYGKLIH